MTTLHVEDVTAILSANLATGLKHVDNRSKIRRLNLTGSIAVSIRDTQELVNFCAEKEIAPEVEVIPIEKVNEVCDRVINKDIRFRFVIDMSPLAQRTQLIGGKPSR